MRSPEEIGGKYDFIWSSCALEHLGSLQAGLDFILRSCAMLTAGGIAVHTTEFNVGSDTDTIEEGDSVIYRRRDILGLCERLRRAGFDLARPDFDVGNHRVDVDLIRYLICSLASIM
jgi:hypothetical protein